MRLNLPHFQNLIFTSYKILTFSLSYHECVGDVYLDKDVQGNLKIWFENSKKYEYFILICAEYSRSKNWMNWRMKVLFPNQSIIKIISLWTLLGTLIMIKVGEMFHDSFRIHKNLTFGTSLCLSWIHIF